MGRKPFGKTKKNNICVSVDPDVCNLAEMMISLKMAPSQGWFYEEGVRQLQARYNVEELDRQIAIAKEEFEARLRGYEDLRSIAKENAARYEKQKEGAERRFAETLTIYRNRKTSNASIINTKPDVYKSIQTCWLESRLRDIMILHPEVRTMDEAFLWMEEQVKEGNP